MIFPDAPRSAKIKEALVSEEPNCGVILLLGKDPRLDLANPIPISSLCPSWAQIWVPCSSHPRESLGTPVVLPGLWSSYLRPRSRNQSQI